MEAERCAIAAEGRAAEAMAAVGRETAARKAALERAAEAEARLLNTPNRVDAVEEARSVPSEHLQTPHHRQPDAVADALAAAAERAAVQTAEAVAAAERSARAEAMAEADEVVAQHEAAIAILQAKVAAAKGAGTDGAAAEALRTQRRQMVVLEGDVESQQSAFRSLHLARFPRGGPRYGRGRDAPRAAALRRAHWYQRDALRRHSHGVDARRGRGAMRPRRRVRRGGRLPAHADVSARSLIDVSARWRLCGNQSVD